MPHCHVMLSKLTSPRDQLNLVENQLRDLVVRDVLRSKHGERWVDELPCDPKTIQKWQTMAARNRESPGRVSDDRPLYQATFGELERILLSETVWPMIEPCFGDRVAFGVYVERLRQFRNRLSHGRDLVPFEEDLVRGIVGQLRQEMTMFRSRGGGGVEPQYFARIDEVVDSYGNRATPDADSDDGFCDTGLTLRPGDVITFTGTATHPRGGGLAWRMQPLHLGLQPDGEVGGDDFTWTVELTDDHIHQQCDFRFELLSTEPPRARGTIDGFVDFRYRVLPADADPPPPLP